MVDRSTLCQNFSFVGALVVEICPSKVSGQKKDCKALLLLTSAFNLMYLPVQAMDRAEIFRG